MNQAPCIFEGCKRPEDGLPYPSMNHDVHCRNHCGMRCSMCGDPAVTQCAKCHRMSCAYHRNGHECPPPPPPPPLRQLSEIELAQQEIEEKVGKVSKRGWMLYLVDGSSYAYDYGSTTKLLQLNEQHKGAAARLARRVIDSHLENSESNLREAALLSVGEYIELDLNAERERLKHAEKQRKQQEEAEERQRAEDEEYELYLKLKDKFEQKVSDR